MASWLGFTSNPEFQENPILLPEINKIVKLLGIERNRWPYYIQQSLKSPNSLITKAMAAICSYIINKEEIAKLQAINEFLKLLHRQIQESIDEYIAQLKQDVAELRQLNQGNSNGNNAVISDTEELPKKINHREQMIERLQKLNSEIEHMMKMRNKKIELLELINKSVDMKVVQRTAKVEQFIAASYKQLDEKRMANINKQTDPDKKKKMIEKLQKKQQKRQEQKERVEKIPVVLEKSGLDVPMRVQDLMKAVIAEISFNDEYNKAVEKNEISAEENRNVHKVLNDLVKAEDNSIIAAKNKSLQLEKEIKKEDQMIQEKNNEVVELEKQIDNTIYTNNFSHENASPYQDFLSKFQKVKEMISDFRVENSDELMENEEECTVLSDFENSLDSALECDTANGEQLATLSNTALSLSDFNGTTEFSVVLGKLFQNITEELNFHQNFNKIGSS